VTYRWDFGFVVKNTHLLMSGILGTLELALVALGCGLVIGLVVGIGRSARAPRAARFSASCYVELFRNTPALIQLLWFYYALPVLTGYQIRPFTAAAVALSLYMGAYCAEIYRSGIESIDRGQWEAGRAIGLTTWQVLRQVVLPQAVRRMVPAFTNQAIELVKTTAIASFIAYGELLYQGKLLADIEFRPIEAFTVVAFVYIGMLVLLTAASARLERSLARSD
jgi:polar amino acid transport system permease protein